MNFSDLTDTIQDFFGVRKGADSRLSSLLTAVVGKYTAAVYSDRMKLQSAMAEFGATAMEAYQVVLMCEVSCFRVLTERDARVQQADLERYIQAAERETGFRRTTVMELTTAIALSLGIAYDYFASYQKGAPENNGRPYVIPSSIYEAELKKFQYVCDRKEFSAVPTEEWDRLRNLAAAGVPRAKLYLGYYLLNSPGSGEGTITAGLQLLQDAMEAGEFAAAGVLGDYYYARGGNANWSTAYEYYTRYGAASLNRERRAAVTNLLNHRLFSRKLLVLSGVLLLLFLLTLIFAPGAGLFAPRRVLGTIFLVLGAAALAVGIVHHRIRPYDDLYWTPCCIFALWAAFIAVRLIF